MIRCTLVAAFVLAAQPALALAQEPPQRPPARPGAQAPAGDLSPAEIQRWFNAYALLQAQEALSLTDEQYPKFLTAMKALQEAQRLNQQERAKLLREINRLTAPGASSDDAAIGAALVALKQQDARVASELQKAYERVDQTLTVRQQARFRLFEEQMERRKLDLLMRARQQRQPPRQIR
jgi:Spy/CpxP family protein refolding chaperone